MKKFYFDCETTGLLHWVHDIDQLSVMVDIDGEIVDEKNWLIVPYNFDAIESKALEVQGRTVEELRTFEDPRQVFVELLTLLDSHVSKYVKADKFTICGFNVDFDIGFLRQFFRKNGHKYYGSYFRNNVVVDPLYVVYFLVSHGVLPELKNYKLATVCEFFEIELKAHDAFDDIRATRELDSLIAELMEEFIHAE